MSKNDRNSKNSWNVKDPRAVHSPSLDKIPRAQAAFNSGCYVEFRTDQMDLEGPWGWQGLTPSCVQELIRNILETQKLTWQILFQRGSHRIEVGKIISAAQKRLQAIQKDDLDELYSLRISGRKRIWGSKEGSILWLLWWDPNHEICPSLKKHT